MRLSEKQIETIISIIAKFAKGHALEIYLYGSRTDDDLKGGDIDLFVKTDAIGKKLLDENTFKILNEIKKSPYIGDRRLDLKFSNISEIEDDPFAQAIAASLVRIG